MNFFLLKPHIIRQSVERGFPFIPIATLEMVLLGLSMSCYTGHSRKTIIHPKADKRSGNPGIILKLLQEQY